jgi:hypothetical protein
VIPPGDETAHPDELTVSLLMLLVILMVLASAAMHVAYPRRTAQEDPQHAPAGSSSTQRAPRAAK